MQQRYCNNCLETKNILEFSKSKQSKSGYNYVCRSCSKQKCKEWYQENRSSVLLKAKSRQQTLDSKYKLYKREAKRRKLDFEITFDEFEKYWQANCYYCDDRITTIGLDRIDSDIGYLITNIVPCCGICNKMKFTYSKSELYTQCQKIVKNIDNNLLKLFCRNPSPLCTTKV